MSIQIALGRVQLPIRSFRKVLFSSLLLFYLFFLFSCRKNREYSQAVEIASLVSLPANLWVELSVPEPLRTPGEDCQGICFTPLPPAVTEEDAFRIEDGVGNEVEVHVIVVGPSGENSLDEPTFNYRKEGVEFCLEIKQEAQLYSPYSQVRLRASAQLELENLRWYSDTQIF